VDWLGILGLAAGLGALTVVLEEGQRLQWFDSALSVVEPVVAELQEINRPVDSSIKMAQTLRPWGIGPVCPRASYFRHSDRFSDSWIVL
jgi:hypothetical protein